MNKAWIETTISEVAQVQSGSGFPEKQQGLTDQPIHFYKVSDMNIAGNEREMIYANNTISDVVRQQLGASIFPKGSTIFPKIGGAIATNKKRLTTLNCCVDNNVMGVIPKLEKVDSEFLYYFFSAHDLSDFANEAHLPSIKKTTVEGWSIRLPKELGEQQRIVSILDAAFEGIATATANAEKNLSNARELFQSYLKATFAHGGTGWHTRTLDQISENLDSRRVPITKNVRTEGEIPYYGASGIVDHVGSHIFNEDLLLVSEDGANLLARTYPIAFSITGKTWVNNHAHVLRFNEPTTQKLVEYYLNSIPLNDFVSGMAQPKLNQKMLNTIPIPNPPLDQQASIVLKLDALSEEISNLEETYQRKLTALGDLKKSILHQAFTGQLH